MTNKSKTFLTFWELDSGIEKKSPKFELYVLLTVYIKLLKILPEFFLEERLRELFLGLIWSAMEIEIEVDLL